MSDELERARELLGLRRPKEAAAAAMQRLRSDSRCPEAHVLLALAQRDLGDHAAAIASAERGIELAPEAAHAHYVHALVCLAGWKPLRARKSLKRALALDPGHGLAHGTKARLLLVAGKPRPALAAARAAVALDPDEPHHHASLVMALRDTGRAGEAAASLARGLQLAPEDPELIALQAELHLSRRQVGPAVHTFVESLRRDPNDERARLGLLEALRAQHRCFRWVVMLRQGVAQLVRTRYAVVVVVGFLAAGWLLSTLLAGRTGARGFVTGVVAAVVVPPQFGNLLLLFHPLGRHVLRRKEIGVAVTVGCMLLGAAVCSAVGSLAGAEPWNDVARSIAAAALCIAMLHLAFASG